MDEGKGQSELGGEDIEGGDEEEGEEIGGAQAGRSAGVGASSPTVEIFLPPARRMSSPIKRSRERSGRAAEAPNYRGMFVQGVKKQTGGDYSPCRAPAGVVRPRGTRFASFSGRT
jgi:hypothetical protein